MTYYDKDRSRFNYLMKKGIIELTKLYVMTNTGKEVFLWRGGRISWRKSLERKGELRALISCI